MDRGRDEGIGEEERVREEQGGEDGGEDGGEEESEEGRREGGGREEEVYTYLSQYLHSKRH